MIQFFKKLDRYSVINAVLSALFLAVTFYLLVGVKSFGENPLNPLELFPMIGLFVGSFILLGCLVTFNIVVKHYRPNYLILGLLVLLLGFNVFAILKFPDAMDFSITYKEVTNPVTYLVNSTMRFTYIIQFFGVIALSFTILDLFPKIFDDIDWTYLLALMAITFALASIIYSVVVEFDFYASFFTKIMEKSEDFVHLKSMFPNKNSYCVILFIGMAASLFIHQRNFKWWWLVSTTVFFLAIMISFCKAFTLVTPVFFAAYLIYRFILSFKQHVKRNVIALSCISFFVIAFFASIFVINYYIEGFAEYLFKVYIAGVPHTFESRVEIWKVTLQILNQTDWAFGLGFHNYGTLLPIAMNETTLNFQFAHNVGVELIANGGIILAGGFVLLFAYIVFLLIKELKVNKSLVIFYMILITALIPIMVVESGSFILPFTMDYAFFSAIILIPILVNRKSIKLPKILK